MARRVIEGLPSLDEDTPNDDANHPVVFDTDSLAFLNRDLEERSLATTHLVSEIGSVVGRPKNARVKCCTYFPSHDPDKNEIEIDWNWT